MAQIQSPSDTQQQALQRLLPLHLLWSQSHMGKLVWMRVVVPVPHHSQRLHLPEQPLRQMDTEL